MSNFQRLNANSNTAAGQKFEQDAYNFFMANGIDLEFGFSVPIGIGSEKKNHKFDLGSATKKIIVECKSHRWTTGNNIPSAKITVWNEAMYYFSLSPTGLRKIFFVLKDTRRSNGETLAKYYIRTRKHMIPLDVEFWEFDTDSKTASQLM